MVRLVYDSIFFSDKSAEIVAHCMITVAHDLMELCGVPELALHLECDDTILMERILKRQAAATTTRDDDNIHTALQRLRTYHKYHDSTMDWLREQHVPVVNLDCSGTPDQVWEQLSVSMQF
jgi:adenylate kinase family enzyme